MKWKFLLIPILLMSLVGICYGENITVELLPSNIEANVGDTFNLSLIVKNVPEAEHEKCAGFETHIGYDPNILNLSNIQLSNIAESADLKMVNLSSGFISINLSSGFISLAWLYKPVYGNFTIATISFKGLNPGETNIILRNTVISTEDGYAYKNVSTYPATVVIKPYTKNITVTVPTITLKKGWNLISIPHRANITFSNPKAVVSIITYYNNTWHNESNLEPLYGYYIYCNNDTIMTIKYIIPEEPTAPPARPVFKGWNLVGVNPAKSDIDGVRLKDFVLPVEDSWIMILDPENNDLYTKYDNISSIVLHPYDAYWMYCKENDILAGRNLN